MKVVPFQKTAGYRQDLSDNNPSIRYMHEMNQPYLYVTGIGSYHGKTVYKLWHKFVDNGDYFNANDFRQYRGKK